MTNLRFFILWLVYTAVVVAFTFQLQPASESLFLFGISVFMGVRGLVTAYLDARKYGWNS